MDLCLISMIPIFMYAKFHGFVLVLCLILWHVHDEEQLCQYSARGNKNQLLFYLSNKIDKWFVVSKDSQQNKEIQLFRFQYSCFFHDQLRDI